MLQKIKHTVAALIILCTGSALLMPALASASFSTDACTGVNVVNGASTANTNCDSAAGTTLSNVIKIVVNTLSIVVGAAAVIMIIVSGFKYVTSGGDSGKVSSAKNTLIYAIVGLVVVASAQLLVHFTLAKVK